jgi:hypothetical protein
MLKEGDKIRIILLIDKSVLEPTPHLTGFKAQAKIYLAFGKIFSSLHTGMEFNLP